MGIREWGSVQFSINTKIPDFSHKNYHTYPEMMLMDTTLYIQIFCIQQLSFMHVAAWISKSLLNKHAIGNGSSHIFLKYCSEVYKSLANG
jgi:hypothetical protein